jgi:hypothetical protein
MRLKKTLSVIILIFIVYPSYSQLVNYTSRPSYVPAISYFQAHSLNSIYRPKRYGRHNPENIVKLELTPLSILNFKIGYERVVNEHMSAGVTLGFLPYRSLPFLGFFGTGGDLGNIIEKAKIDGFSMCPELRGYLIGENEVPKGFYISGYAKYSTFGLYSTYNYSGEFKEINSSVESRLSRYGIGVAIGYQWIVAEVISLDLTFFALGIERYITTGSVISSEFSELDLRDINNDIRTGFEENGFGKLETQIGYDYVKIKHKTFLPATKFTFSIGYAFD